jgi:hypothetical protein
MNTRKFANESKSGLTSSVLVFYENRSARARAVSFCERLIEQSGVSMKMKTHWCSFDALKAPVRFDGVINHGCEADVVLFSVSPEGDFPHDVKLWTERWMIKRGDREGVLVGLVDKKTSACEIACLKEIYLRHLAHRAGLDYLSQLPHKLPSEIPDLLVSLNQRAGQVTSVLDEILHTRPVPPRLPLR